MTSIIGKKDRECSSVTKLFFVETSVNNLFFPSININKIVVKAKHFVCSVVKLNLFKFFKKTNIGLIKVLAN